jgi:mRNA interferase MazF
VRRGDIVTAVIPGAYGKPRPAVVVQRDALSDHLGSTVVCPLTSDLRFATDFRVDVEPSPESGLRLPSRVMVDKVQALPTEKVGAVIGRLTSAELQDLNRALMVVLDLP